MFSPERDSPLHISFAFILALFLQARNRESHLNKGDYVLFQQYDYGVLLMFFSCKSLQTEFIF